MSNNCVLSKDFKYNIYFEKAENFVTVNNLHVNFLR